MSRRSVFTIFLLALIGCGGPDRAHAPSPVVFDLDGNALKPLDSSAVTVVLFTRSDCPVSNRYAPEVHRLYDEFHPRGVKFYLVYVDPAEDRDAIRKHLSEYDYPCPGLRDPKHALVKHCGAKVTPEAAVFAAGGTMTYRGRIDDRFVDVGNPRTVATTRELYDAIEATLANKPVVVPRADAVGCLIADVKI